MKQGFPPIADKTATLLILGTMPGGESLKQNEYYAHPRNAFWTIMERLFGCDPPVNYKQKTRMLSENRIALWDVIKSCKREGSLDAKIINNTIIENDFASFFNRHPNIGTIFFNGARAKQEYVKRVLEKLSEPSRDIKLVRLPSTSPAMAQLSLDDKVLEWSKILRAT